MSLPSIAVIAKEMGINLSQITLEQQEELLVGALKVDFKDALKFLHTKAHEADKNGGHICGVKTPTQPWANN